MNLFRWIRTLLDAHRARRIAIQEVYALRGQLELANEQADQLRAANLIMAARLESERSMLNDQWEYAERLEKERDFWKGEALKAGAEVVQLRAAMDCPLIVERLPLRVERGGLSA